MSRANFQGNAVRVHGFGARLPSSSAGAEVVGGKAAGLMRLARLGLPVPPGLVFPTELSRLYFERGEKLPDGFRSRLATELRQLERATGSFFGGARRPLVVSVRSGAPVSMPGMMETVLDVGLNDTTVQALLR